MKRNKIYYTPEEFGRLAKHLVGSVRNRCRETTANVNLLARYAAELIERRDVGGIKQLQRDLRAYQKYKDTNYLPWRGSVPPDGHRR